MANRAKVGIVGVGNIGTTHANVLRDLPGAEIVAMCDIDAARLKAGAEQFGVKHTFSDYHDLVAQDLDAVYVCVWNNFHRDVAVAALEAGKHVFCEKPMALNAAQGIDMVRAARKAGRVLQIGMVWRQNPQILVARDLIERGEVGDVYHIRSVIFRRRGIPGLGGWFTTKNRSGGGPVVDIGVHWFDLPMHLAGLWQPTAVSANTYAKFGPRMKDYTYTHMWAGPPDFDGTFDVEDYAAGFVRFGEKASMSFELVWAANGPDTQFIQLLGDKGGLRLLDSGALTLYTEHAGRVADITPQYDGSGDNFVTQAKKFFAACRGEMPPAATGEQGVAVMRLMDAVYASGEQGKEVAIPTEAV